MSPEEKQAPLDSSGMPPETFHGLKTVNRYNHSSKHYGSAIPNYD